MSRFDRIANKRARAADRWERTKYWQHPKKQTIWNWLMLWDDAYHKETLREASHGLDQRETEALQSEQG